MYTQWYNTRGYVTHSYFPADLNRADTRPRSELPARNRDLNTASAGVRARDAGGAAAPGGRGRHRPNPAARLTPAGSFSFKHEVKSGTAAPGWGSGIRLLPCKTPLETKTVHGTCAQKADGRRGGSERASWRPWAGAVGRGAEEGL